MAANVKHALYAQSLVCAREYEEDAYNVVYHIQVVDLGDGRYQVQCQYGRVGCPLTDRVKFVGPLQAALGVFNATLAEKTSEHRPRVFCPAEKVIVPEDVLYAA